MKKLFLFATLFCVMCAGRVFAEDPDIVWWKNYSPERITDVKYHPDGERIFVATEDKTLVLSAENGEIIHELPQGYEDTHRIDISQDGNVLIASGNQTGGSLSRIIKWNLNNYTPIYTSYIDEIFISPEDISFINGDKFIVVTSDMPFDYSKTLIILDAETLDVVKYYGEENTVFTEVAASPDGKYFATISKEKFHSGSTYKLTLWDAVSFEKVKDNFDTSNKLIGCIKFSSNDEDLFFTMGRSIAKYSIAQDIQNENSYSQSTFISYDVGPLNKLCFSGMTTEIAYTATYDFVKKEMIHHYSELSEEVARGIELSPDNSLIAHGGYRIVSLLRAKWNPTDVGIKSKKAQILYPNPTTGSVIIGFTASKIKSITISNEFATLNEKIDNYQILSDSEISIDLSKYPDGVYFIRVETVSGLETFKVIKGGLQ